MTIRELIDRLADLAEEHGDGLEVRLAEQPQWAFEYAITDVVAVTPEDDGDDDAPVEDYPGQYVDGPTAAPVVYVGEGKQLGYLPGAAANALGWRRER
jgi:hypothetical protein